MNPTPSGTTYRDTSPLEDFCFPLQTKRGILSNPFAVRTSDPTVESERQSNRSSGVQREFSIQSLLVTPNSERESSNIATIEVNDVAQEPPKCTIKTASKSTQIPEIDEEVGELWGEIRFSELGRILGTKQFFRSQWLTDSLRMYNNTFKSTKKIKNPRITGDLSSFTFPRLIPIIVFSFPKYYIAKM
jgi:hypothetical protein